MLRIRRVVSCVRDLLFPRKATCALCGGISGGGADWICGDCREALLNLPGSGFTAPAESGMVRGAYAFRYEGAAANAVKSLKYSGYFAIAPEMAKNMTDMARRAGLARPDVVCAVPMHFLRKWKRGYNHAEILARHVAEEFRAEYRSVLRRTRRTPQQAKLTGSARLNNVKRAFRAEDVEGKRVLLVDDVYTTGATAANCADALRQAGATRVEFLCYARTERHK